MGETYHINIGGSNNKINLILNSERGSINVL